MGEVFRALDRLTGQVVALKRVRLPLLNVAQAPRSDGHELAETLAATPADEPSIRPQEGTPAVSPSPELGSLRLHLTHEFRTLAGLRHPHIVSVLDYGFDRHRQPYFTMELLENGKSFDEAARNQPRTVVVGLLLQILQALTYLHQRGVLHRDLKPGNILVVEGARGPQVKLLDFGLVLFTRGLHAERAEVAGTLGYIAPEILLGEPASVASDLFAVGVMAHDILAGSHPIAALPTAESIQFSLGLLPAPSEQERLDAPLGAVLRRALLRDPAARYVNAVTFGHELASATGLPLPRETLDIRDSFLQAASFQSRDGEMEALLAALRQALRGRGQVLLVGGESGIGKSRLLDEFRAQALVRGALTCLPPADPAGSSDRWPFIFSCSEKRTDAPAHARLSSLSPLRW